MDTVPFVLLLLLLPLLLILLKSGNRSSKLPPGSLGLPFVGQSLSLLQAMRTNKAEEWVAERIENFGPVSKLNLFGTKTILLVGPAANKFMFTNPALAMQQPKTIVRIVGKRNLLELDGEDHKRVRGAVTQFLKPEMLKKYVGRIDAEVRDHLHNNWTGRHTVTVMPLVKSLTFNIICSLMFGIEEGPIRNGLTRDFADMIAGAWAVPVNLPFTNFNKSLRASQRARKVLHQIVRERRDAFEQGKCSSSHADLITYLISLRGKVDDLGLLSDDEIVDNAVLIMVAGHDTSSILITFMIRHLAKDPATLAEMVREHESVAKSKAPGESLTWEDLSEMKFTWRVALETLRMVPPLFGNFRKAIKDVEFNGYIIPKGWQVFWVSYLTHMDQNIFIEPSKFDPTRFENQSSVVPYSYVAFGGGPRICPGNEFARVETLVMMHYLVTGFNWKLCCKEDVFRRDPMPSPSEGLPIQLEPRN